VVIGDATNAAADETNRFMWGIEEARPGASGRIWLGRVMGWPGGLVE
jgi:hypothetical protein